MRAFINRITWRIRRRMEREVLSRFTLSVRMPGHGAEMMNVPLSLMFAKGGDWLTKSGLIVEVKRK